MSIASENIKKMLIEQQLNLLKQAPNEFIVACYNLSVNGNLLSSATFHRNTGEDSEQMDLFEQTISPLQTNSDKSKTCTYTTFYDYLWFLYEHKLDQFKENHILSYENDTSYGTIYINIYDGLVYGYDQNEPDLVFYTKREENSMNGIIDRISQECQEYLNSEGESEQE